MLSGRTFGVMMALVMLIFCGGCRKKSDSVAEQVGIEKALSAESTQAREAVLSLSVDEFVNAALDGDFHRVAGALAGGAGVNDQNGDGRTALMLAAFNGHTPIMALLISQGADVSLRDSLGRTALMYASTGPDVDAVTALLDAGAEVNVADSAEHWTPLMFAAAEGREEVVRELLLHGADASAKDVDGDTASRFAVQRGHREIASALRSAEAINPQNTSSRKAANQ